MEQFIKDDCHWHTCKECKKFYAVPRAEWIAHYPDILCFRGHTMTYHPNSTAWEQLTAIYALLSSLYITMPRIISFAQYEYVATIMTELKEREEWNLPTTK